MLRFGRKKSTRKIVHPKLSGGAEQGVKKQQSDRKEKATGKGRRQLQGEFLFNVNLVLLVIFCPPQACDFCGRKFCDNAFERHVEFCK